MFNHLEPVDFLSRHFADLKHRYVITIPPSITNPLIPALLSEGEKGRPKSGSLPSGAAVTEGKTDSNLLPSPEGKRDPPAERDGTGCGLAWQPKRDVFS